MLVSYLSAVYNGTDTPRTLAQLTGDSYEDLDQRYRKFIAAAQQAAEKEKKK